MAWAIDATSFKNREDSPTSPETISHTCTGSNLILFSGLMYYAASPAGTAVVSNAYNGSSMSKLQTTQTSGGGGSVELWYLVNPSTGTNNISVSWTGTNSQLSAANASFTGLNQTPSITDSDVQAFSVRTSSQVSLTGMNTGDLIVGVSGGGNTNYNVNTGTTLAVRPSSNPQIAMGYLSAAASSDTIDFTNGSDWTTAIAGAFAEAGASTTIKTYLGTVTANVKTVLNGTAIASRKTWNGIA